jgi:hypothetical protein
MTMRPTTISMLFLLGCGGGTATTSSSAATGGTEPAHVEPTPPERPWAELSDAERRAHMARHVVPVMSELFAGYDADRFADVSCTTCHGEGAAERGFAMPNPDILPLYPTGTVGQYQAVERYPEGVRFMYSRVVPAMQTLLGAAEFDPATGEGFTCFACHTHAPDDDPLNVPAPSSSSHEPHTALEGAAHF